MLSDPVTPESVARALVEMGDTDGVTAALQAELDSKDVTLKIQKAILAADETEAARLCDAPETQAAWDAMTYDQQERCRAFSAALDEIVYLAKPGYEHLERQYYAEMNLRRAAEAASPPTENGADGT